MSKPTITPEEFANWREDPVTQWVLRACETAAKQCEQAWNKAAWSGGNCDPLLRMELFTLADGYRALAETNWTGWFKTLDEESYLEWCVEQNAKHEAEAE